MVTAVNPPGFFCRAAETVLFVFALLSANIIENSGYSLMIQSDAVSLLCTGGASVSWGH